MNKQANDLVEFDEILEEETMTNEVVFVIEGELEVLDEVPGYDAEAEADATAEELAKWQSSEVAQLFSGVPAEAMVSCTYGCGAEFPRGSFVCPSCGTGDTGAARRVAQERLAEGIVAQAFAASGFSVSFRENSKGKLMADVVVPPTLSFDAILAEISNIFAEMNLVAGDIADAVKGLEGQEEAVREVLGMTRTVRAASAALCVLDAETHDKWKRFTESERRRKIDGVENPETVGYASFEEYVACVLYSILEAGQRRKAREDARSLDRLKRFAASGSLDRGRSSKGAAPTTGKGSEKNNGSRNGRNDRRRGQGSNGDSTRGGRPQGNSKPQSARDLNGRRRNRGGSNPNSTTSPSNTSDNSTNNQNRRRRKRR